MTIFTLPVIVSALGAFAPKVAKWVAGDKGEHAAKAVLDIAKQVTGIKVNDPIGMEKLVDKLATDPNLEQQFIQAINAKEAEFDKLYLEDVQHAREVHTKSTYAREFIYRYAWFLTTLAFVYIGAITFLDVPESSQRFADTILGFLLGTVLSAVIQFFYGASKPVKDDE